MAKRMTKSQKLAQKKLTRDNFKVKGYHALYEETDLNKVKAVLRAFKSKRFGKEYRRLLQHKVYDHTFPASKLPIDTEYVNLRNAWIISTTALDRPLSNYAKDSLLKYGYMETMLRQVSLNSIGKNNYKKLKALGYVTLTAEFLIYNFFDNYLDPSQRQKIIDLLRNDKVEISKVEVFDLVDIIY